MDPHPHTRRVKSAMFKYFVANKCQIQSKTPFLLLYIRTTTTTMTMVVATTTTTTMMMTVVSSSQRRSAKQHSNCCSNWLILQLNFSLLNYCGIGSLLSLFFLLRLVCILPNPRAPFTINCDIVFIISLAIK